MKVFAVNVRGGGKAKKRETVQASRAYTPKKHVPTYS